jgi:hypothetical protein
MGNLTQIIKDDFHGVGQALRGIVRGAVQGIYTPALMNTGVRQFSNELARDDKLEVEIIAKNVAQIVSSCGVHVPLAIYAIEHGRGLEYFGALATTNVVDYLVHTYKRSKE